MYLLCARTPLFIRLRVRRGQDAGNKIPVCVEGARSTEKDIDTPRHEHTAILEFFLVFPRTPAAKRVLFSEGEDSGGLLNLRKSWVADSLQLVVLDDALDAPEAEQCQVEGKSGWHADTRLMET